MATDDDLDVDTDLIRRAAALLRQASDTMPGRPVITVPAGPDGNAAGTSAQGRQALRLAVTRAEQGVEAAASLAKMSARVAGRLYYVAQRFDEAEALLHAGR